MCLTKKEKKKCRLYGSKDFMNLKNNNYANKENSAVWASILRARDLVVELKVHWRLIITLLLLANLALCN